MISVRAAPSGTGAIPVAVDPDVPNSALRSAASDLPRATSESIGHRADRFSACAPGSDLGRIPNQSRTAVRPDLFHPAGIAARFYPNGNLIAAPPVHVKRSPLAHGAAAVCSRNLPSVYINRRNLLKQLGVEICS